VRSCDLGKLKLLFLLKILRLNGIDSVISCEMWASTGFRYHKKKHSSASFLSLCLFLSMAAGDCLWLHILRHPCTSRDGGGADQHATSRWKFVVLVGLLGMDVTEIHIAVSDSVGSADGGSTYFAPKKLQQDTLKSEASLFLLAVYGQ